MTKIEILRKKVVETVEKITDEAVLTSMLVFASTAAGQAPVQIPAKTRKTKTPKSATEKTSSKLLIVRYEHKGKPMVAVQTVGGKPDEAILTKLRALKEEKKLRFYVNAPINPLPGNQPFWAGAYDEAIMAAFPSAKVVA
jgi:hypothetical protein